ncbi:SRPBCC family protein [Streptomyces roseirectus]|uniref:SRPBCC family protein n=1 Tax=Streptomyces roseirectus TaxID=2768066 RepID=A0A7H0I9E1_9ACTN|nr:SRPBCC family protein [Streptomyces roseirectus]QNP69407.1 SRPBCC family protein [Streptomyces roseirectus]
MVTFELHRTVPLPPEEAWNRLTAWHRHGDVVPLTRVTVLTPAPTTEGTVFVARTGLGPLSFDDRMEVTLWHPPSPTTPGLCRLEKRGRVVLGRAEIEVGTGPGGRAHVVWREELAVRFLPNAFDPALRTAARSIFGRAINRLLRGV